MVCLSQQAMHAVCVVLVNHAAIATFRFMLQLFAVNFTSNAIDIVTPFVIQRRVDTEVLPKAVSQIEAFEEWHDQEVVKIGVERDTSCLLEILDISVPSEFRSLL